MWSLPWSVCAALGLCAGALSVWQWAAMPLCVDGYPLVNFPHHSCYFQAFLSKYLCMSVGICVCLFCVVEWVFKEGVKGSVLFIFSLSHDFFPAFFCAAL